MSETAAGRGSNAGSEAIAWMYALTIAGYPLVSILPAAGGFGSRFVSVPYRGLVLGLALGIVLVLGIGRGRMRVSAAVWLPLGLFWFLYILRLATDTVFARVALRQSPLEYVLYIVGVSLVPMLAFFVRPTTEDLARALRRLTLLATLATAGLLALSARSLLAGDLTTFLVQRFRTDALNPTSLGHLGASLAIVALFQLLAPVRPRRPGWLLAALGMGFVAVFISASRAPMLVLAMVLPLMVLLAARRGARRRAWLTGGILAVTLVGGFLFARNRFDLAAVYRLTTILDPNDLSNRGRIELMSSAWSAYVQDPALGSGLEERRTGYYPHNVVLEAFMATGMVGGFALILVLGLGGVAVWRVVLHRPREAWVGLLCFQYVFSGQVASALWSSAEMWALLAAVFALAMPGGRPEIAAAPAPGAAPAGAP